MAQEPVKAEPSQLPAASTRQSRSETDVMASANLDGQTRPTDMVGPDQLRHNYIYGRHHRHRHSHNCYLDEQYQSAAASGTGSHKSGSPSSSTASDSAFSQSQSTLGSVGEHSSSTSFARSASGSTEQHDKRRKSLASRFVAPDKPADGHSPAHHDFGEEPLEGHFRIVWRNLSYRVPEKRLSRFSTFLRDQVERFLPQSKTNKPSTVDEQPSDEPRLPAVSLDKQTEMMGNIGHPAEEHYHMASTVNRPRELIFSNLNGCVKSGELTAILGPSGAGKTTLLKCLTNSIVDGVTGSIDIIGDQPANTSQQLKLCIIPQKDYLFDNLTVIENLLFASRIKNTQAHFDHTQNVHRVANLLGLHACLKIKTSKLSGGQYKRVSIAQELLSKPDILILDEPTSGLDSLTCFRTVSVLRDLVNKSRTGLIPPLAIVMTIHQPQIKIFNQFHRVYILGSKGQCVYEGKPEYLIDTVADCCKLLPPPDDLNPASFIIDLGSGVYGQESIDQLTQLQHENSELEQFDKLQSCNSADINDTADSRPVTKLNTKIELEIDLKKEDYVPEQLVVAQADRLKVSERFKKRNCFERTFWLHTGLLVKRLWISTWRDPLLTTTRITFHLIIPFVFYIIYSQKSGAANACPHVEREIDFQSIASDENIQRLSVQQDELILTFENTSLFFLLLYSFSMCVLAVTALSFPLNMQILLKETSNGWYSMPRFVMAKTLADLPIELTMPMVSVAIAYVLTGQPSSYLCWRMLTVTLVMTLCSLISQTQGLLFGAYFMNNIQAAVFVSQAASLPWILLSGFTTRVSELPNLLQWLSFGSIYRLGIESIVAVRYGFGICSCDQRFLDDTPAKIVGIPDQLKQVIRYYMESYSQQDDLSATTTPGPAVSNSTTAGGDMFEKLAATLSRANTYGVDIVSCRDVRPFIMSAREVDEETLPKFLIILFAILLALKISLFFVVRLRTG